MLAFALRPPPPSPPTTIRACVPCAEFRENTSERDSQKLALLYEKAARGVSQMEKCVMRRGLVKHVWAPLA